MSDQEQAPSRDAEESSQPIEMTEEEFKGTTGGWSPGPPIPDPPRPPGACR